MSRLSLEDKVLIVQLYYGNNRSETQTLRKFRSAKGFKRASDGTNRNTIRSLICRFEQYGNIQDKPRCGRPSIAQETVEKVADVVSNDPHTSSTQISNITNTAPSTVRRILHQHLHMHPYRIHMVHKITEADESSRLQFCYQMLHKIQNDSTFINRVLWTDEAHFHLTGAINSWNCRVWSTSNPHECHEQPLWSPKLSVWIGFSGNFILDPYFFEDESGSTVTIRQDNYSNMIVNHVIPQLKARRQFSRTVFQQDGAPPHTANSTKSILIKEFGMERLIGKGFDFCWPPRSPDLSPPDFWLWGWLKANVYNPKPTTLEQLKRNIQSAINSIPPEMLQATVNSIESRLQACIDENGRHLIQKF